jgi:outer membrane protein assembly factor BamA
MNIKKTKLTSCYFLCTVIALTFLAGCNNTKHLPANDALYTGASVQLKDSTANTSKKERGVLTTQLNGLTRPRPNSKVLGMRLKLGIWNLSKGYDTSKPKGLNKLLRKWGEPPVLLSQVNLRKNEQLLTNFLENRGFFHATTVGDTTVKNKKARATYDVQTGVLYKINDVSFPSDSSRLSTAIRDIIPKTILKKGAPFNLDVIKGERTRIDAYLKENGFYYFNPDYLIILVDSTIGNNLVNLYMKVKPEAPTASREQYRIKEVFIYSNYNLTGSRRDTTVADSMTEKGYVVIDRKKTFNPKVFDRMMRFQPGDLYNRTDHNLSLSRLINLGTFKFVKNRFEPVPDTTKLNAFYYLTPLPKKSLSAEIGGLTKSNNSSGTEVTLRWKNRNTFKQAELLTFNAYGGVDVQYSAQFAGISTFRTGAEGNLTIPRFVIPIFKFNTKGSYVPRTNIQLGYDILNRKTLYTINQFRTQLGYIWKESLSKEHTFNPIAVNYVQPIHVTQLYRDSLPKHPELGKIIDTQFIVGSNYNFNYNQLAGTKEKFATGFYFNGLLDLSGNLIGALTGASKSNPKQLLGAKFSQYIKTELDTRYYLKVGQTNQWANRIILGFGVPRGQSQQLPFVKQFFVGGNNSLRAFRSRSVGPGKYYGGQNVGAGTKGTSFFPDQTGDIKLELNSEFRAKIYSIFDAAVFVDAGNIWLYNENPDQPGGKFTKDFLKELAIGAGVGLRVDLTILLLRLDLATPIRKPWLADPTPKLDLKNKENLVLNLAIGLPF